MAGCHHVMLLLDAAGGAAGSSRLRRTALRLLGYLSCRFGLARLRWAFKCFDSAGARGREARGSDFRELRAGAWQDLEAELEARAGIGVSPPADPRPEARAAPTQRALLEALLDYHWDQPEIASPAKTPLLDDDTAAQSGPRHAVFLLAPCPRSSRDLLHFAGVPDTPASRHAWHQLLLPKRLQDGLRARGITLCWVDTGEPSPSWNPPDDLGYRTVCELLHHVGGTVVPSETFSQDFDRTERVLRNDSCLSPWVSTLPTDSTLNRLLCPSGYESSFPGTEGTLLLPVEGGEHYHTWVVILEPLTMHQRPFPQPPRIFLQGLVTHWSPPKSSTRVTESWMLRAPEGDVSALGLSFQQLLGKLAVEDSHLVACVDPCEGWPPVTGVLSPLSNDAAVLTVFLTTETEVQRHFLHTTVAENSQAAASLLSSVLDDVLGRMDDSWEDPTDSAPVPEWAQQELGRSVPWSAALVEKWFARSHLSGASTSLMESFCLLQAASMDTEESSRTESELTGSLSELYQRKSREESAVANQEDSRKKRGVPRTPVRQKMTTMCRSLKMLNVARLNVKASQKLRPDGSPDAVGEKGPLGPVGSRSDLRETRGRTLRSSKPKDFPTEEALLCYVQESYRKAVTAGDAELLSCAQSVVLAVLAFWKSKGTKDLGIDCLNHMKNNLLKTSRSLRGNLGEELDKADKVRECQLQVFLRMELCQQCPSLCESGADLEQMVEEAADLLRMVCLTQDSAYLAALLDQILGLYINSIPKILGDLYHSLGFVIPSSLARVLPADFFSDDSLSQESKSPLRSEPCVLQSVAVGTESDQLEELRTRSAKKRRKNALKRHKSITEGSQNLRQIEIPKASRRTTKSENSRPALQLPSLLVKDTVQEVTKVRRNLFNQKLLSPSKTPRKQGLPRSYSVSAVDGLESRLAGSKRSKGCPRLLTKSVAETPVHKQTSRRLLHRQIQGRSSNPGPENDVVEESPIKAEDEAGLRRSPRIKQLLLARTSSGCFYSQSQPKAHSVQRVHSFQHVTADQRGHSPVQRLQTPKRLLFGSVTDMSSPPEKGSARAKRPSGGAPGPAMASAAQTPRKRAQTATSSAQATPGRAPQGPCSPPERPQEPPLEVTPAKQAIRGEPLAVVSPQSCATPPQPQGTPQRGASLASGTCPLRVRSPRTPRRKAGRTLGLLQDSPRRPSVALCPEDPGWLSAPVLELPDRTSHEGPTQLPESQYLGQPAILPSPTHLPPCGPPESPPRTSALRPLAGQSGCEEPQESTCGPPCTPHRASRRSKLGTPGQKSPMEPSPAPNRSPLTPLESFESQGSSVADLCEDPCSPVFGPGNTWPLPVPDPKKPACRTRTSSGTDASDSEERPPPSSEVPQSSLSLGLSSPLTPFSFTLPPEALPAYTPSTQASASPWDDELEPDESSGLPSLQIRKRDPGVEAEPQEGESPLPRRTAPGASKSGVRPETVCLPAPCPWLSHSTPSKGRGQTYICQSCTPTRSLAGTLSPPSWSPSPKPGGKGTPEAIRDWPRKKRAADYRAGRAEGGLDPTAALAVPSAGPECHEQSLKLASSHKAPAILDFELEGVFQLPALSPAAEEAPGTSKRPLSPQEGAESRPKRTCEPQGDVTPQRNEEGSPRLRWSPLAMDDDDVFVSGSTPPPGNALRSCLSASGLQALTQSPLLFQGKAPPVLAASARGDDGAAFLPSTEESPCSQVQARGRPFIRTYTRKKLLS